jgi:LCP family protein required for cell wall assembly
LIPDEPPEVCVSFRSIQPNIQPMSSQRFGKRNGCLSNLLLVGIVTFALFTFCSLGTLLFYVLLPPPPLDLLILGMDARPGENYATRTDAIMIMGIQPQGLRTSLLSIPRDIFIQVPDYGSQRINTINVLGEQEATGRGVPLLQQSIAQSFDLQTDRYVKLNFQAFVALIDAVGGVTIDVPKAITDYQFPTANGGTTVVTFEPGVQTMDGERALTYARTRHADDDYQRASRQQQVLSALAGKLVNPLNWGAAIVILNQNMETDLTLIDMARYAPALVLRGGQFDTLVIDREYILPGARGAVPDYEKLASWINERFE